ncbi:MAG: anti-sigma factor family protein [Thermomicrobiales bacterium]
MTIPYRGTLPIDDELLSAYLDGQVSPDERVTVEAAIAADPAVRARVTDLRATVALLRALPQPVPRRTFILTPAQAASIRPVRAPWPTRLFPAVAAVSAVAAVLCLMLIAGDLGTGVSATTKRKVTPARPAVESASNAAVTRVTTGAVALATAPGATTAALPAAPTSLPAPAAAAANAPAPAATTASARSAGAPPAAAPLAPATAAAGAILLPTGTAVFASAAPSANSAASQAITPTALLPVTPTIVANVQSPPPAASAPSPGGAVVTMETHRVPVALVRAGEVFLALLAVAGVTLAVLGRRKAARA